MQTTTLCLLLYFHISPHSLLARFPHFFTLSFGLTHFFWAKLHLTSLVTRLLQASFQRLFQQLCLSPVKWALRFQVHIHVSAGLRTKITDGSLDLFDRTAHMQREPSIPSLSSELSYGMAVNEQDSHCSRYSNSMKCKKTFRLYAICAQII